MKRIVLILSLIVLFSGSAFAGPPGLPEDVMYRDWRFAMVGETGGADYSFDFTSSYADTRGDLGSVALHRISGAWVLNPSTGYLDLLDGDVDIVYTEKVTDGVFEGDGSAWTFGTDGGGGWVFDNPNNEADCDGLQTGAVNLQQNISAVAGHIYRLVFTTTNRTAGTLTPQVGNVNGTAITTNATFAQIITATTTGNLKFQAGIGWNGTVDTVSCKDISIEGTGTTAEIMVTANGLPFQGGPMVNRQIRTRVLNGANWTPTNITLGTGTGIDGQAALNIKLTASANNGTLIADAATMPAAATNCTSAYFKRVTGTGAIYITDDNGANWTEVTGVTSSAWTRKFITRSQASVQQGFKLATSGDSVLVDFSEIIAGQAYPSLYGISLPAGDNTSPVGMTGETGSATNGYYNTMSAAFKAIYDTGGEGTTYIKFKFAYPESVLLAEHGLWGVRNTSFASVLSVDTNTLNSNDIAHIAEVATPAFVYGDILEVCIIHPSSTDKFRVGYSWNGAAWVWGAEAAYDGDFTLGTTSVFGYGNPYPMWIEKLEVYKQAHTTTWVESKY